MRTGHKASGAVLATKLIYHEDEAHHRPLTRLAPVIRVKLLRGCAGIHRSGEHRTEVERSTDNAATCLQDRLINVEIIEVLAAIDEVMHARRRPPAPPIISIRAQNP